MDISKSALSNVNCLPTARVLMHVYSSRSQCGASNCKKLGTRESSKMSCRHLFQLLRVRVSILYVLFPGAESGIYLGCKQPLV